MKPKRGRPKKNSQFLGKQIKLSSKHPRAGTILSQYLGKDKTVVIKNSSIDEQTVIVRTFDYLGFRIHLTKEWLDQNPEMWVEY